MALGLRARCPHGKARACWPAYFEDACKPLRRWTAAAARRPRASDKPEIKPEPEIKEEPEPFTIRGYFGFHD